MIVRRVSSIPCLMQYMAPNTGAGSGGTSAGDGNKTEETPDEKGTSTSTGGGSSSTGANKGEKTFTQAELDEIISRRLGEQKRSFEKQAEDAKAEQARKEEEAKGEFKKLYETELANTTQLKSELETAKALIPVVTSMIESEIKDWPVEVKASDPGADNIQARLKWVESMRPLAKRLIETNKAPDGEHSQGGGTQKTGDAASRITARSHYAVPGQQKS